jgi:hypothetical protein
MRKSFLKKIWEDAESISLGIDVDDSDFIALTKYLKENSGREIKSFMID